MAEIPRQIAPVADAGWLRKRWFCEVTAFNCCQGDVCGHKANLEGFCHNNNKGPVMLCYGSRQREAAIREGGRAALRRSAWRISRGGGGSVHNRVPVKLNSIMLVFYR